MNTRIRELMLEAGYAAPELAGRAIKLTTLLLEECLLVVSKTPCPSDEAIQTMVECHNRIYNHFGIENA